MRSSQLTLLLLFVVSLGFSQADSQSNKGGSGNPLADYLDERDEMGRVLSHWGSKDSSGESWFFGSHAMLVLRENGQHDTSPFPGLASIVPGLWSDIKFMSPRYLIELAGGALSSGGLMTLTDTCTAENLQVEERFIRQVAGFSHLRMLHGTVGDSLYLEILDSTVEGTFLAGEITANLIHFTKLHAGDVLGLQFERILRNDQWLDVSLDDVKRDGDSLQVRLSYTRGLRFPLEILVISETNDSSYYYYSEPRDGVLKLPSDAVKRIILDPNHILSEYLRANNKWPRLKEGVTIQPFIGLPDWEKYRVVVSPSSWSDWDGDKRYGVKFSSGYGVDLWPAYPSDYRHRFTLELNAHGPIDEKVAWGSRLNYGHPLNLPARLFSSLNFHSYDDWQGVSIGLRKYIGKQTFLIQGSRLNYQRLALSFSHDKYGDPDVWVKKQSTELVKLSYTGLSLTKFGDRLYLRVRMAQGAGPDGGFTIGRGQVDLTGVFWRNWVTGLQFVLGSQSDNTPNPYQFTHSYAWQDALSALPNFRGQTKITDTTREYLGVSVSGGYLLSWMQLKLFSSSMMYAEEGRSFDQVKPRYAAGFGFEHKSIFTAGLYFPIWQSVPDTGERPWQWRYQWQFTWNL